MREIGLLGFLVVLTATHAVAQPVIGLEGAWDGKCTLGSKTLNASLLMDQLGGHLNGKPVTGLKKGTYTVQFKEGKKTFSGTFSNDTSSLTAKLTADGKEANCSMSRRVKTSDRLCIRNLNSTEIYFRLEPGSPSTIRVSPGQDLSVSTGDRNGKLCWDALDFTGCPRSLPQSTYAC